MANWTTRKSQSQKIGKASFRTTQTFTYGKGLTNSQSFGSKVGRTTFSTGPKGTKVYNTVRNGDFVLRTQKTLTSNKTKKPKNIKFRKGSNDFVWFLVGIVFVIVIGALL